MRKRSTAVKTSILLSAALCGCAGTDAPTSVQEEQTATAPVAGAKIANQAAVVGQPFNFDATLSGTAFSSNKALTYTVRFPAGANGLSGTTGGTIIGAPAGTGLMPVIITAANARGDTASQQFTIVAFAAGLTTPSLPLTSFAYSDASSPLVPWYRNAPGNSPAGADNTPTTNTTTDAGATLGRVLFYDKRLSVNDRISCASCHQQQFGFADTARLSRGFNGGLTDRHAMALGNARFYQRGRFFWDERASTLEEQVLQPIQNSVEMGMTLSNLVTKVAVTSYYPALFTAAFGSNEITSDRIARALAQFVRSMTTSNSKYDMGFGASNPPTFANLTAQENLGLQLFNGQGGCGACHGTAANISDDIHNNGLDAVTTDQGAGGGQMKAPSLRNVAIRAPYMHDGRFRTLDEVVGFYNNGVQNNPNLDRRLRNNNGQPRRLGLTQTEQQAIVAYLRTLTDSTFIAAAKYSDPFVR